MRAPKSRTVSSIGLRIPCVHLLLAFLAPGVERVVHHRSVLQHLVIVLKIAREAEENRSQAGGLRRESSASGIRRPRRRTGRPRALGGDQGAGRLAQLWVPIQLAVIRTLGFATGVVVHRAPVNCPPFADARVWLIRRLWHIRGSLQTHCGNSLRCSLGNAAALPQESG